MKQKLTLFNSLYDFYEVLGILALTMSLTLGINDLTNIDYSGIWVGLSALTFIILLYFVEQNRTKLMLYVVLAGIIILFGIIFVLLKTNPISLFRDMLHYLNHDQKELWVYSSGYSYFAGLVISMIAGLCSYFISKLRFARLIAAAILFLLLVVLGIYGISLSKITIMFLLFYCISNLADFCSLIYIKKEEYGKRENTAFYLMPFCLVMTVFIALLPAGKEPIKWTVIVSIYEFIEEKTQDAIVNVQYKLGLLETDFHLSFSGYSGKGKLGGTVSNSRDQQLQIDGYKTDSNVYFIGSVFDYYTGEGWETQAANQDYELDEYKMDYYETLVAMSYAMTNESSVALRIKPCTLKVLYTDMLTNTLFYPQKTFEIMSEKKEFFKGDMPGILLNKVYRKGLEYRVEFLDIDYSNREIMDMFRSMDYYDYASMEVTADQLIEFYKNNHMNVSTEWMEELPSDWNQIMDRRAEYIKSEYCMLPEGIPDRVYELTKEITAQSETDFDKCKALEAFLSTSYKYSMTPPLWDTKTDFVDSFLFEGQEGYCTYFATAMAVMGRMAGLPTRYVEGFCLDYSEYLGNRSYELSGENAHAWCEVYIEGAGWIPFEATAGEAQKRYKQWKNVGVGTGDSYEYPDSVVQPPLNTTNNIDNLPMIEKKAINFKPVFIIGSYIIVFLLIFFIGYFMVMKKQRNRKYKEAANNEKILLQFTQILKLLEIRNKGETENATVSELFEKIRAQLYITEDEKKSMMNIFIKLRYSTAIASIQEVTLYETVRIRLEQEYLVTCNLLDQWYYKMFKMVV